MNHAQTYLNDLIPRIDQLFQIIKNNQKFVIVWHSNPDGDCLGSMLGLWGILEWMGKQVQYCASRPHEASMSRIAWSEKIQYYISRENEILNLDLDQDTQVVIFVDHNKSNQRSDMKEYMEWFIIWKQTVCIDHHICNEVYTDLDIIDASSSSACELIREILQYQKSIDNSIEIHSDLATLFYTGLTTDTGGTVGLEYEKNPIRSHENALEMLRAWADKKFIINKLNEVTLPMLEFAKLSFDRMQFSKHCLRTWSTAEESKAMWLDGGQIKIASSIMKRIIWIKVVIRFAKNSGKWYTSIRTATGFNVQQIAQHYGWGWHILAAWCKLEKPERDEKDLAKLVQEIDDKIDVWEFS